ncbi:hypothetical protein TNCV_4580231 [Trichonephila clavipes]|nr:hypothetical protein TNCV_4580231 [Trichonephila clavipes]
MKAVSVLEHFSDHDSIHQKLKKNTASVYSIAQLGRFHSLVIKQRSPTGYGWCVRNSRLVLLKIGCVERLMLVKSVETQSSPVGIVWNFEELEADYQTDVHIFSQCLLDNHESAASVIGNFSTDHNSRCRSSVSWPQTVRLQEFIGSPCHQHTPVPGIKAELLSSENTTGLYSILQRALG